VRSLPAAWFRYSLAQGVSENKPGIYEWKIEGVGCYIGRYSRVNRPKEAYGRNVLRLLNNLPYRKNKPHGFRRIHRALAEATEAGRLVELFILENAEPEKLNAREQALIRHRRREAAVGGLPVLNSMDEAHLRRGSTAGLHERRRTASAGGLAARLGAVSTCLTGTDEDKQMTVRSRMPVTMDGIDYPSARQAFMALGLSKAQRQEPRKELRRTNKVEIALAGRTHVIKRREP
jgi:hypothetical protein